MKYKPVDSEKVAAKAANKMAKAEKKQRKQQMKLEKKQKKHAVLSVHKRPIVCPPDRAGRNPVFRLTGYICRTLVIWAASAGLVTFISSALELGVAHSTIFLVTLLATSLVAMALYNRIGTALSIAGAVGSLAYVIATRPRIFTDLLYGVLSVYNAALERLYRVGYLTYIRYQVSFSTATPVEELLATGVCVLCVIVSVVFTLCLVKRVRIIPPAILATTFLVVILTFNVYSNRIQSNLGIALVIISFATVFVMSAYDRLYRGSAKDANRYDTQLKLFADSDRPTLPPEYLEEQEQKAAAKAAKKTAKQAKSKKGKASAVVTVDDELADYFGGKRSKPKKVKEGRIVSPAEKKAEKERMRALRRQVRAVKHYDRVTEQSRAAMGGFASAAMMLLCLLIIALPALSIQGNFNTIDAIDEKMAFARDYVTAVLRGDDERLDELEYGADQDNFKPHSTALEQLEFTEKQIFYIESRYNTNYYLRGWIGTGYEDGAWLAVDDDTLATYRDMFDTSDSPGEELRYGFYHYMMPSLVDDENYTEHYLTKYKSNLPYGFVNVLVSLRRVNSPSTLTYFPSSFKSNEGIFDYGTTTLSELTYVNYFDGIYTGRKFADQDAAHATVTYAPVMTDARWAENQAELIAAYNLQKEALLAQTSIDVDSEGKVDSDLTLLTEDRPDGTTLFSYQYKSGTKNERVWRFYHDTDDVSKSGSILQVSTEQGVLTLTLSGKKVQSAEYVYNGTTGLMQDMTKLYNESMTDAERDELMDYIEMDGLYSDFVYDTYTGKSDSSIIAELAGVIQAQTHTEEQEETLVEEPDDPETPEDESYSYIKREWVDIPVDVSLAAVRNSGSADVYVQRDLLVRNVIDYIIYEQGCEYTITPDLTSVDASLDGVENFLVNTKEGYCVQFASAAALILRELGIPTRYVEGYIAASLERTSSSASSDITYGGYVRDYEAHAWIEVYFDGVGWVQYETTPSYYGGMYGVKSGDTIIPTEPIVPPSVTDETDEPNEPVEEPEPESDTTEETTEEDNSQAITQGTLVGLGILVVIGVLAGIIGSIVSGARRAEDKRQSLVSQVLESNFGNSTSEEDRREMALELTDAVTTLLRLYDLSPKAGEFRDEYADRLTAELNRPDERERDKGEREAGVTLPDLHLVLDAMAAEEFGHGMSISDMKQVAILYLCLRKELRRRIPLSARFHLRYIKRLI